MAQRSDRLYGDRALRSGTWQISSPSFVLSGEVMNSRATRALVIAIALVSPTASHAQSSEGPAVVKARELIAAINGGNDALRQFVTDTFSKSFLDFAPVDMHLKVLGGLRSGGDVTVETVQPLARSECRLVLRSGQLGEHMSMRVAVDPAPPHRIRTIGVGPSAAPPVVTDDVSDAGIARALDALLARMCENDGFSGTVMVARDGQVLFQRACGLANRADRIPMRIDTKLNLGSMNKMITAVAIAQLVESGKLAFDDPVGKHLPDYPNADVAAKVRIHHLLTHTSGLGSFFSDEFQNASRTRFRTVQDFMGLVQKEKLAFEPGARWQYSNSGFLLLGAIVEKVSGRSYFDYVRERIYQPAGMPDTDAYEMDEPVPNLAIGYVRDRQQRSGWRNNLFMHVIKGGPAGGGFSTAGDLIRFAEALRHGRLVTKSTWELLASRKPELSSPDYGYGFAISGDGDVVGHTGGFPGISAQLAIYPKSGYASVALSNYGTSATAVVDQVRALVYEREHGKGNK
jgi:CubicO group peptidase (beta-lactamase class C family)